MQICKTRRINSGSVLVVVAGEHKYRCQASKGIVSRSSGYSSSCSKLKLNLWCRNVDLQKLVKLLQVKVEYECLHGCLKFNLQAEVDYDYLHGCFSVVCRFGKLVSQSLNLFQSFVGLERLYELPVHTWILFSRLEGL